MMASAPRCEPTPYCLLIQGSVPYSDPIFSGIGLSTDFCREVAASFQKMRHLTQMLETRNNFQTNLKTMSFSETRMDTAQRLLSVANTKPTLEMSNLDYQVEICRLAALIYIKVALHTDAPLCSAIRPLRSQLMNLIKQGEVDGTIGVINGTIGVGARQQPVSITWALFVVGSLTFNREEQEWFAQRLGKGIRGSGVDTWSEMEYRLRQICWLDKLNTATCRGLWSRIMVIHEEDRAAQVRHVTLDCDRTSPQ